MAFAEIHRCGGDGGFLIFIEVKKRSTVAVLNNEPRNQRKDCTRDGIQRKEV
jgi:hypothetical protein